MSKSCQEIIKEILLEATEGGKTISEKELMKKLDAHPTFWTQAILEEFNLDIQKTNSENN